MVLDFRPYATTNVPKGGCPTIIIERRFPRSVGRVWKATIEQRGTVFHQRKYKLVKTVTCYIDLKAHVVSERRVLVLTRKVLAVLLSLVIATMLLNGCGKAPSAAKVSEQSQDTASDTVDDEGKAADFSSADQGKQFAGKTWIALGDSITEKNFRAKLSYYDYVIDDLGCEVVNYGKSGTGYKEAGPFEPFYERVPQMDLTAADCLTVFGSFNDLGKGYELGTAGDETADTIGGCMNLTMQRLRDAKPGMSIGVVTPTRWLTGVVYTKDGKIDRSGTTRDECDAYVKLLKDVAACYGFPVLDLYEEYSVDPDNEEHQSLYFTEDGVRDSAFVHPQQRRT